MQKNEPSPTSVRQNGFRDFPFQSQEFGQDGHRHFAGVQPHFHLNMTSQSNAARQ